METKLTKGRMSLADFAAGHEHYGLHRRGGGWVFREWAPNATAILLVGDFCGWQSEAAYPLAPAGEGGDWELRLPLSALKHGDRYKLLVHWPGGSGERIPSHARRVVQDPETNIFAAEVWAPEEHYAWRYPDFRRSSDAPRIYEAHVGIAQDAERVGTFDEFRENVLPRVIDAGYNTLQLMAVQEHPYYGSCGYHVSSFFAVSSRFGTPYELKQLVDAAHEAGLSVIMDLVHSHAVRNEAEGLSRFDGTLHQYFHGGERGLHRVWDSRCFDYGKPEVLHFLLSNCRFWLDEYRFDGFRFDGVTSMLFLDHGLERIFTSYEDYFGPNFDECGAVYLALANKLIHQVRPDAITIAEDVSGTPGVAAPLAQGGLGFNYRLAMGIPDYWIKLVKHVPDHEWHVGDIFHELTNRREEEKVIGYVECHDQALVGDQTLMFRLAGVNMYDHMGATCRNMQIDRAMALHKVIRLLTVATAGHGYLNFIGNEFGHPEWLDFPREGNGWSYAHACRQWHLRDDPELLYRCLAEFDKALLALCQRHGLLDSSVPERLFEHTGRQVIAFARAGLLFLANLNPEHSADDVAFEVPAGAYDVVLESDAEAFGGHGRLSGSVSFRTRGDFAGEAPRHRLRIPLPPRAALVLRKSDRRDQVW